ncbi:tetratricopeptide repeat protein [Peribacillus kribbensis]|uniref:tetratricopeptide repeat protein n=1 Tax=Peribacillus kribbensis TaxID=356658 RepID=UPI00041CB906|nr:tetratricopeptide repeat protein [Peribacillus kribbensis]
MREIGKQGTEIELLSKVFQTEGDSHIWDETFKQLHDLIKQELVMIIDDSKYPEKASFLKVIENFMSQLQLFITVPALREKTVIGVMHTSVAGRQLFYDKIIQPGRNSEFLMKKNRNIPIIHCHSEDERIYLYNAFHNREEISRLDIRVLLDTLARKYHMDLRNVITYFLSETPFIHEHITYIDFSLASNNNETFWDFLDRTDALLVNIDIKSGWDKPIRYLNTIGYNKKILLQVPHEDRDNLLDLLMDMNLNFAIMDGNLFEALQEFNVPSSRKDLFRKTEQLIQEVSAYIYQERNKSLHVIEKINRTLLMLEHYDKSGLIKLRTGVQDEIDKATSSFERLQNILTKIQSILSDIKESIIGKSENGVLRTHQLETLYRLSKSYIGLEKFEEAESSAEELLKAGYKKANLLLLTIGEKKGESPSKSHLDAIHLMDPEDPEVLEAKIKYKKELGFQKLQVYNFVLKLKDSDDSGILFILGQYYENQDYEKEAAKFYRLALEKGNKKAGGSLFSLYQSKKILSVEHLTYLGNYLNRDANFQLGSMLLAQGKEQEAIIRLSLAAIYEHSEAIFQLAELFYRKRDYNRVIDYAKAYLGLDKKEKGQEIQELLGVCYYNNKDYEQAYETLCNCSTGEAYFLIGQMYETGAGKMKNMELALQYYSKGSKLGHNICKTHHIKITARLEEEKKKKEQGSTTSYSSSSSYSKSSSGSYSSSSSSRSGCFLTTATCMALGKKDNCEEILAFKKFRDEWLIMQEEGSGLIQEYYHMAPALVEKIDSRKDALQIYQYIWNKYIQNGYKHLLQQDFPKAKEIYVQMVLEIQQQYL